MMKKLLKILLTALVLTSCATTPRFSYPIDKPSCDEGDIVKWCITDWDKFVSVSPNEQCPEDSMVYSTEIQVDCFRKINLYIQQLELRKEDCNQ